MRRKVKIGDGKFSPAEGEGERLEGLTIVVPFLTGSIRNCTTASGKVTALELLVLFAQNLPDAIILQRLVPYAVTMLSDPTPIVRASAVKCLDALFHFVRTVPPSEVKLFPEYILPTLHQLSMTEQEEIVLLSLTSSLASFANSARRFMENAQLLKQQACADDAGNQTESSLLLMTQESYDSEMASLIQLFTQIVHDLMTRHSIDCVKFEFINIAEPLAHFFGQRRANETILPLLISVMNDSDWRLREALFKNIVGLAAFIGRDSLEQFFLPIFQQAITDYEENVIYQTVTAMTHITQLGLFQRRTLIEFTEMCAPMLLHPNQWIKYSVIGLMEAICAQLEPADVFCFVLPKIRKFLRTDIVSVTRNILLQSVIPPVLRTSFDKGKLILAKCEGGAQKAEVNMLFAVKLADSTVVSADRDKLVLMEPYLSACCRQTFMEEARRSMSSMSKTGSRSVAGARAGYEGPVFNGDFLVRHSSDESATPAMGPKIVMHAGWHSALDGETGGSGPKPMPELGPVADGVLKRQSSDITNPYSSSVRLKNFRPKGIHIGHLTEHEKAVTHLRVSDDEKFFVSGSKDGMVKIWDCSCLESSISNRARRTFCASSGSITGLTVCEGTHSIAVGYESGSMQVLRVDYTKEDPTRAAKLSPLRQYDGFSSSIVGIENLGRSEPALLAYGLSNGIIGGIDLRCKGESVFCYAGKSNHGLLESFAVAPDRSWLLTGTSRGFFVVWDLRFGLPVITWRHPTKRRIRKLAHKEDCLVVAAVDSDDVMIWDVSSKSVNQLFSVLPAGAEPHPFLFAADMNPDPPMDYGTDDLKELQSWSDKILRDTVVSTPEAMRPDTPASSASGVGAASSSGTTRGPAPVKTTALYCTKDTVFTGSSDCCVRVWETSFVSETQPPHSYTMCGPPGAQKDLYSAMVVECCIVQQASSAIPSSTLSSSIPQTSHISGARQVLPESHRYHHDAILDIVAIDQPTPKILTAGRDGIIKVWK